MTPEQAAETICGLCVNCRAIARNDGSHVYVCALDPPKIMLVPIPGDPVPTPANPNGIPPGFRFESMYPSCIMEIGCSQFLNKNAAH